MPIIPGYCTTNLSPRSVCKTACLLATLPHNALRSRRHKDRAGERRQVSLQVCKTEKSPVVHPYRISMWFGTWPVPTTCKYVSLRPAGRRGVTLRTAHIMAQCIVGIVVWEWEGNTIHDRNGGPCLEDVNTRKYRPTRCIGAQYNYMKTIYYKLSYKYLKTIHTVRERDAYPIEFHTLLRHRMHADFLPKTLAYTPNKKWRRDATFASSVQTVIM